MNPNIKKMLIRSKEIRDENRKATMYLNRYSCNWCQHEFERRVGQLTFIGSKKTHEVSDQIKCPRCSNFIPTWDK